MSLVRGFSLVETMIVVVVAGIILAAGMPAFSNYRNTMLLKQAKQQLTEDLRTARQFAVTRRAPVFICFGTPPDTADITTYTIHVDKNANGVVDGTDRLMRRVMPGTTRLASVSLAPRDTVAFDISGILLPGTGGGTLIFQNARNKRDTLIVSAAGIAYRP